MRIDIVIHKMLPGGSTLDYILLIKYYLHFGRLYGNKVSNASARFAKYLIGLEG